MLVTSADTYVSGPPSGGRCMTRSETERRSRGEDPSGFLRPATCYLALRLEKAGHFWETPDFGLRRVAGNKDNSS